MKPCQIRRKQSALWMVSRLRRLDRKGDGATIGQRARRHDLANTIQIAWAKGGAS
jgi:hypothetical protein